MPDRALRPFQFGSGQIEKRTRSENPQCPTGHYDSPPMEEGHTIWGGQKTPNARQGITTHRPGLLLPLWHVRKPPMPDRALRPKELRTRICWPRWVRKPPMPDRALRLYGMNKFIRHKQKVRKPPMPDRALRLSGGHDLASGKLGSENPQCPTGHYDPAFAGGRRGTKSQKTPNARQGITTILSLGAEVMKRLRQKTPNARQGITTLLPKQ